MESNPTVGTPPGARISNSGKFPLPKITKDDMNNALRSVLRKLHDRMRERDADHDAVHLNREDMICSELRRDLELAKMEMAILNDLVPETCILANKTTEKVSELSRELRLCDLIEKRECAEENAENLKKKHEAALEKLERLKREEEALRAKPAAIFLTWSEDARALRDTFAEEGSCGGEIFDSDMEEEGHDNLDDDVEMGSASLEK